MLRSGIIALLALALLSGGTDALGDDQAASCPEEMALVDGRFCVDRFEAHLEQLADDDSPLGALPPNEPVKGRRVRARSARGVLPQAHVSQSEADAACKLAGKRLCENEEWLRACKGPLATRYPYGTRARAGACNDRGVEPLAAVFRSTTSATWGFDDMNDPRLQLVPGGVARTGRFARCQNELGVHDMVGNLHEWTASSAGTMRGGYYLDTSTLGEGCDYAATGHDTRYHDYSTGFRCCLTPAAQ